MDHNMSVNQEILRELVEGGFPFVEGDLSVPPNPDMGDLAIACFRLAKEEGKSPAALAHAVVDCVSGSEIIDAAKTAGPYVNLTLSAGAVAQRVLNSDVTPVPSNGKKIIVEYGCPNVLKAFHIGHMKNIFSGESISRLLEWAGYSVIRVNYQGDVGMHIAKAMWGIFDRKEEFDGMISASLPERTMFLGSAYAHGARAFEDGKKDEIVEMNRKIYEHDSSILETYQLVVKWSLEYFDVMYDRLGTQYDHLFFESQMTEPAKQIIADQVAAGILKESDGAVIFEGSAVGLHDRVFLNSQGFPTYEGKDLALSQEHAKFNPEKIIHVVGKEQTEYFKVVIAAMTKIWPEIGKKQVHIPGGFLQLKGDVKMSSRKGTVVTADDLLDTVSERVRMVMEEANVKGNTDAQEKVTLAALKYAMLRAHVSKDAAFDMQESVSLQGDSGPYLLYIVARVNGILEKALHKEWNGTLPKEIHAEEKALLLMLDQFHSTAVQAAEETNPSLVAAYCLGLAQQFNRFYAACPVIQDDAQLQAFRLALVTRVKETMVPALLLLGIAHVDNM